MGRNNYSIRLHELVNKEFSPNSSDDSIMSGYNSLIDLLEKPNISSLLSGCHDLIFQCISRIILNPCHRCFQDNQLKLLFDLASNSRLLTMFQNQILDSWHQNVEERSFQTLDDDDDDDDDDKDDKDNGKEKENDEDWSDTSTESDDNEQKYRFTKGRIKKRSFPSFMAPNPASMRHADVINSRIRQQPVSAPMSKGGFEQENRCVPRDGVTKRFQNKGNNRDDLKSIVTVEVSHQSGLINSARRTEKNKEPMKSPSIPMSYSKNLETSEKKNQRFPRKDEKNRTKSTLNTTVTKQINKQFNEEDQSKIKQIYNYTASLINCGQTDDERNNTFLMLCTSVEELNEKNSDELTKKFREKEPFFYSFVCHVAQNEFLFTQRQYDRIFALKKIILVKRYVELDENRSIFSRRRTLVPLNSIGESLKSGSQMPMTLFNDLQEYVIRSQPPISSDLFEIIRNLLKSTVYVDTLCLDYFVKEILFGRKKLIFADLQIEELESCLQIRTKRNERSKQKQIWKQRLLLLKHEKLSANFDEWINDLVKIFEIESNDLTAPNSTNLDHAIWYFATLSLASCLHITQELFRKLLGAAVKSPLFNQTQKFYFNFYLSSDRAPINVRQLKDIERTLKQSQTEDKILAYKQIVLILEIEKPQFIFEQTTDEQTATSSKNQQVEDLIPIVDEYIVHSLVSLVELICWDKETFPNNEGKQLAEQMIKRAKIVHPIPKNELKRLTELENEILTLAEFKQILSSTNSDLTNLIKLLKERTLPSDEDFLDFLTLSFTSIFEGRERFSHEQCQQLKDLIEKHVYGKTRFHIINTAYAKHRPTSNKTDLNQKSLTELLGKIFDRDEKAATEFVNIFENISKTKAIKRTTIDWQINRSLLSALVLTIINCEDELFEPIHQRLKTLINGRTEFVRFVLGEEQMQMIEKHLKMSNDNFDVLIETIKTNFNEENFRKFLSDVENQLKEDFQFEKLFRLILSTFDDQSFPRENISDLIRMMRSHSNLKMRQIKQNLQFLSDLLNENIYASPSCLNRNLKSKSTSSKALQQTMKMLTIPTSLFATNEWKKEMVQLLISLHNQKEQPSKFRSLIEQSPMLRSPEWKNQLKCYWRENSPTLTKDYKVNQDAGKKTRRDSNSTTSNNKTSNENSEAHRLMFQSLLSDDQQTKLSAINQCRQSLIDERLPPFILLSKFIQALETIIKMPTQQNSASLNQWTSLIRKNRGKIFTDDAQCDDLLVLILFISTKAPIISLPALSNLVESKNNKERSHGFRIFLQLLKNTTFNDQTTNSYHLPTVAEKVYKILTNIIFTETFDNEQIKQCLNAAKKSWLFSDAHRAQINKI